MGVLYTYKPQKELNKMDTSINTQQFLIQKLYSIENLLLNQLPRRFIAQFTQHKLQKTNIPYHYSGFAISITLITQKSKILLKESSSTSFYYYYNIDLKFCVWFIYFCKLKQVNA